VNAQSVADAPRALHAVERAAGSAGLQARLGQPLFRLRRLTGTGTYQEMLKAIVKAMDQGLVWPLHSYDPLAGGTPKGRPCFSALIPGKDEEGVQGCMDKLAGLGIVP